MQELINLLITYWKPIVGLLFTITGFIIALLKKRPVTTIVDDIYQYAVKAINEVEKSGILGASQKLAAAVQDVVYMLLKKYPTLDTDNYRQIIVQVIESILSTPQKKG